MQRKTMSAMQKWLAWQLCFCCVAFGAVDLVNLAKDYHAEGMRLASNGRTEDGLYRFRAACKAQPGNALFQNDLGVTEMRMGQYELAQQRFLTALDINPDLQVAHDNVRDLKDYMDSAKWQEGERQFRQRKLLRDVVIQQEHSVSPLPVIAVAELGTEPYPEQLKRPFMLKNVVDAEVLETLSMEDLAAQYPDANTDFYPHNMQKETVRPFMSPFEQSWQQLFTPSGVYVRVDASTPSTYIQWNLDYPTWTEIFKDVSIPAAFTSDEWWLKQCMPDDADKTSYLLKTHWRMLLMGNRAAGMFNHKDTLQTSSWQLQIQGRKLWHLCPSSEDANMYAAGAVNAFAPDYERYPNFRNAKCYQQIVEPGQMLFYPKNYWHQTMNLDTPTVSVTGTLVTPNDYKNVRAKLQNECDGNGTIFSPNPRLCSQLKQCFALWDSAFGQSEL